MRPAAGRLYAGSLWLGSKDLAPADVWRALTRPDDSYAALVLASRVPRTLLAFLTGWPAADPDADPQPAGRPRPAGRERRRGASIVTLALVTGALPAHPFWAALPGALAASAAVYWLGAGGRGLMPVRLILAGAALNAVLYAYVQAVALLRSDIFDVYRFWAVGSLAGHSWPPPASPRPMSPPACCWPAGAALNLLALGGGMARALGLSAGRHRLAGLLCMAVLAAAATAACGPIAFVGWPCRTWRAGSPAPTCAGSWRSACCLARS